MSFDWKKLLGAVAPVLGTAIGGPFGAMAAGIVDAALGLTGDADEAARAEALKKATPEQLLGIQQAEQQFKLDMEKLGVDVLKIDAEDRASARKREMSTQDWLPKWLAVGVTLGFFGLLGMFCFVTVPEKNQAVLNIMIGALGGAWASIISYYYGSSSGSAAKDRIIAQGVK